MKQTQAGTPPCEEPVSAPATNVRRGVVVFGASIAFLSFLDRAAISQAAPAISKELHRSVVQIGLVFFAFGFTYAAGEIPSGWLCDRLGARLLLTRVVLLWSFFTAATGWAWNFPSFFCQPPSLWGGGVGVLSGARVRLQKVASTG
jgi:ACS family glucarate transporter-like MFS transporter